MRRVTLGGPALRHFFVEEPGEIVTMIWPAPGAGVVLPRTGWRFPPGVSETQHARNYSVRQWRADAHELDVDFVVHADHGFASRWAGGRAAGRHGRVAGPRTHWTGTNGAAWSLLVADETGLPALAAIVETFGPGQRATALVEVAGPEDEQPLESAADLDVRWLRRDGARAVTTTLLADAIAALALPGGTGRVWGGGEALAMRHVRRRARDVLGLPPEAVSVLGYWKHRDTDGWE